jgi:hypothetical protein
VFYWLLAVVLQKKRLQQIKRQKRWSAHILSIGSNMLKRYLSSNIRIGILTLCGIVFMSSILNPQDRTELLIGMAFMGLTIMSMMDAIKRKNKKNDTKKEKRE